MVNEAPDPVRARRARIAHWVRVGTRTGYALLGLAMLAFAAAAIAGFPRVLVSVTVVALVAACAVLPVPIVVGYGVRAAEREDRARGQGGSPPTPRR